MTTFNLIGYANGQTANDSGCADGPEAYKRSTSFDLLKKKYPEIKWDTILKPDLNVSDKIQQTREICEQLALQTKSYIKKNEPFITLGGDHSCAIGTWSGAYAASHEKGNIGLIWVDAHMDSHTPETSPSNNIHGMPLATLLGYGHESLTSILSNNPKLLPENVCLVGIRSYESGEAALLDRLGIRIFKMEEIEQKGLSTVFREALSIVQKNTIGFGISIDLDAIDPLEAPGVGCPAPNGISANGLIESLAHLFKNSSFLGVEIAEFNPHHDREHKTENIISALIDSLFKLAIANPR